MLPPCFSADMIWSEILEKARNSEDKSWLAGYMPELCSTKTLEDDVRLRVLGNAVANDPANGEYLLKSNFASELISPNALNLSVLLNYCVDFPPAAHQLFLDNGDKLREVVVASKDAAREAAKHLVGVIGQEIDFSTQPLNTRRRFVLDGFIELILSDPELEQDPEILANFPTIYEYAIDLDNYLDAMQVVGNITCHKDFVLENASDIDPAISPIFFIILANLTGKLADVPGVMEKFPDCLQLVLDFVNSDDFEHDEYNSCAHFLRNVGRISNYAEIMAESVGVVDMAEDLLESPFAEVGIQLLGVIGQHVPKFEWFQILSQAQNDPSINAALLVAYSQLCIPLGNNSPGPDDLEPLGVAVTKIVELLEATPSLEQTTSLWLKGSKALALLSQHTDVPSVAHLQESAPKAEGVQENFKQIVTENDRQTTSSLPAPPSNP